MLLEHNILSTSLHRYNNAIKERLSLEENARFTNTDNIVGGNKYQTKFALVFTPTFPICCVILAEAKSNYVVLAAVMYNLWVR